VFEDEDKTRVANLLNAILLVFFLIAVARAALTFGASPEYRALNLRTTAVWVGSLVALFFLMRAGYVRLASIILTVYQWLLNAWLTYSYGGVSTSTYSILIFVIFASGLLLGGRVAVGYAALSVGFGTLMFYLESQGLIVALTEPADAAFNIVTPSFISTAVLVYLYHRDVMRALARARENEQAMAAHADEVAQVNTQLSQEIAERERAETQVRRLAGIPEASTDFIGIAAPDGTGLYINPAGLAMTGYTAAAFYGGMRLEDFQPALPQEAVKTALRQGTWYGETTLQRKDGHLIPVSQVIMAIKDEAGEVQHFATIARDLTLQKEAEAERTRLQQEIIEAQQQALRELTSPVIPVMDGVIVLPLIGSIDSQRAQDIMRRVLAGISEHGARVVILDVTGVPLMDTGIVNHLNKTIQAARLKGARVIVTGISDAVAEAIVDLGIDWRAVRTLRDLQTGLRVALNGMSTNVGKAR
jgi:rsbT co-antagonist protein RsbR